MGERRSFKWAKGKMRQAWFELTKDSCGSAPLCEGWGGVESFTGLGSLEFKELNLKYNQVNTITISKSCAENIALTRSKLKTYAYYMYTAT